MFGYVIPLKGELKVREFEVFKSYYCGLCSVIGEKSTISRLALTYDMTFLGILLSSLYISNDYPVKKLCGFKMKSVTTINKNEYMEYAADMNIIFSNRKLLDDYRDDKNYLAFILSKFIRERKLSNYAESKLEAIDSFLKELYKAEKSGNCGLDEAAHYFAELTSEIFNLGNSGETLKTIGYNLGKWIYTIDAYDDIEEDIKMKRYNPCLISFGYKGEDVRDFKNRIEGAVKFTLIQCLHEMSKAFETLDIRKNRGIIENIIYLGLERTTMNRFEGGCGHEKSLRGSRDKGGCFSGTNKAGI